MKKYLFTLLLLAFTANNFAQLNEYKYIIVPAKFDVFPEKNSFQTSTLIKYLFTQSGFNAVYDNDLPVDLYGDPCLGTTVDLEKTTKLARSRLTIIMKDCNGVEIFRSVEGISKSKDYKEAYHEAIKGAFVSFENMDYQYTAKQQEETLTVSYAGDIKEVEEKKEVNMAQEAAVIQVATPDEQLYESNVPEPSNYVKAESVKTADVASEVENKPDEFQARALSNGYELLDGDNQLWLTLFETSTPDVFLARNEQRNGMVYKKESKWYFEFYENSDLIVQEIRIDFQ